LTRSFYYLNTRPLQKKNWKKPELEKKSWSRAMMNSRKRWKNKQKKQTGWWNRWWRCSKNKSNPSCTPLACFYFYCLYLCLCLILNLCLCFWITTLINTYVLLNNSRASDYKLLLNYVFTYIIFSLRFSHLLFLCFFYTFCWWQKGGVDV